MAEEAPSASEPVAPTGDLQAHGATVVAIFVLSAAAQAEIAIRPPPRFAVQRWLVVPGAGAAKIRTGWPIWAPSLLAARRLIGRDARRARRYMRDPSNMVAAWEIGADGKGETCPV